MEKKKKQHYVPRCYLDRWASPQKHQVFVYNKMQKKSYISSIYDIASERYFYDLDFTGIVNEDELQRLGSSIHDPKLVDSDQYIENFLASVVESDFKNKLSEIIDNAVRASLSEIKNHYFLSERNKFDFSAHLAIQFIRVKAIRNSLGNTKDILIQTLKDMGAAQNALDKYDFTESQLSYLHGKLILNKSILSKLAQCFFSLTWILLVNRTSQPFYTSDHPIGTIAHIQDPIVNMAGLGASGVEACFPISPNLMLLMVDGTFHTQFQNSDRSFAEINDVNIINYYNSMCILNSDQCVFSVTNDFSIVDEIHFD